MILSDFIYDFDLSNVVSPFMVFVSYSYLIQSLHIYVFSNMVCSNCEKKNRDICKLILVMINDPHETFSRLRHKN